MRAGSTRNHWSITTPLHHVDRGRPAPLDGSAHPPWRPRGPLHRRPAHRAHLPRRHHQLHHQLHHQQRHPRPPLRPPDAAPRPPPRHPRRPPHRLHHHPQLRRQRPRYDRGRPRPRVPALLHARREGGLGLGLHIDERGRVPRQRRAARTTCNDRGAAPIGATGTGGQATPPTHRANPPSPQPLCRARTAARSATLGLSAIAAIARRTTASNESVGFVDIGTFD